ncbi:hypothetical protein DSECCO2_640300 [anaerobic digester metagenome]
MPSGRVHGRGQGWVGIAPNEAPHALGAAEVLAVPVENAADVERAVLKKGVGRVVDASACGRVQGGVQGRARIGRAGQRRAALGGAVDREMHAGVVELRPQDAMLHVVEADRTRAQAHERALPGRAEKVPRVLDGADAGVVFEDELERPGVVDVDIVGEALLGGQDGRVHGGQGGKGGVESCFVFFQSRVVHHAVRDMGGEQRGVGGVAVGGAACGRREKKRQRAQRGDDPPGHGPFSSRPGRRQLSSSQSARPSPPGRMGRQGSPEAGASRSSALPLTPIQTAARRAIRLFSQSRVTRSTA